jgi:hypothetical protein
MSDETATLLSIGEYLGSFGCTFKMIIDMTDCGAKPGPALCSQGCRVGLRDRCWHGYPSLLLTLLQYDNKWDEIGKP